MQPTCSSGRQRGRALFCGEFFRVEDAQLELVPEELYEHYLFFELTDCREEHISFLFTVAMRTILR